jgi:hypothetical protein
MKAIARGAVRLRGGRVVEFAIPLESRCCTFLGGWRCVFEVMEGEAKAIEFSLEDSRQHSRASARPSSYKYGNRKNVILGTRTCRRDRD